MAKNKLEPITAEDLYSFKYPYNVSYNKSGTRIAFTVTTPDKKTNGYADGIAKARILISRGRRREAN